MKRPAARDRQEEKIRRRGTLFILRKVLFPPMLLLGVCIWFFWPRFSAEGSDARGSALLSDLQTVRSQIELFTFEHDGLLPGNIPGVTMQEHLTSKTNADGSLNPGGELGPYLQMFPTNPFIGTNTVNAGGPTNGWLYSAETGRLDPDNTRDRKVTKKHRLEAALTIWLPCGMIAAWMALSLAFRQDPQVWRPAGREGMAPWRKGARRTNMAVRMLLALVLLSSIMMVDARTGMFAPARGFAQELPCFQGSCDCNARRGRLFPWSDMHNIRVQITLFTKEHLGVFPGNAPGVTLEQQLTMKTNADGTLDPNGAFGPYLQGIPHNPFTHTNTISIDDPGSAYNYNPETGIINYNAPDHVRRELHGDQRFLWCGG